MIDKFTSDKSHATQLPRWNNRYAVTKDGGTFPAKSTSPNLSAMHDRLLEQDLQHLLQLLQEGGPKTAYELHQSLRLSLPRVSSLLHTLELKHLAHTPNLTTGKKGNPVNLWEATRKTEGP